MRAAPPRLAHPSSPRPQCFTVPCVRHVWWWLGFRPATKASMAALLKAGAPVALCPGGVWTPTNGNGTVCQLMGSVRMPLDAYNTIPLYSGMNAACGSQWPAYERCAGGGSACAC